jgi:hypothetical protein
MTGRMLTQTASRIAAGQEGAFKRLGKRRERLCNALNANAETG